MGIAHFSKLETIKLSKLALAADEKGDSPQLIKIPKYQRGIVWSSSQRLELLESVYKGYPIGSLLCHDNRETVGTGAVSRQVWELVDGLQRTTTLLDFLKQPLELVPVGKLIGESKLDLLCATLLGSASETNREKLLKSIEVWCREVKVTKIAAGFSVNKLYESLSQDLKYDGGIESVEGQLAEMLDEILQGVDDIKNIEIPLIVYSGPGGDVPTIFQLVNSTGTQLTKYQVFAATWSKYGTRIKNASIRKAIQDKYLSYVDRGYRVQGFTESTEIPEDAYNLYEYLYGLGQVLCSHPDYGKLFPDPEKDADDAAAVAFNLVTVASGLRVGDMHKLASHLAEITPANAAIDLFDLEEAIFKACSAIYTLLRPSLELKLNAVDADKRVKGHSQNQVMSLILRHLIECHEPRTWTPRVSPNKDKLETNIPRHYLYDIIAANWRSAGEKRLFDSVWSADTDYEKGAFMASSDYLTTISRDRWEATLSVWFQDQLGKKQTTRPSVTEAFKVYLRFLYSPIVSFYHNHADVFELEHLYPVKVLSDAIKASGSAEGWSISNVGNLCLLPKEINRIKGEKLLGEYMESPQNDLSAADEEQVERYVITPNPREVKLSGDLVKEDFDAFCQARFDVQVEKLLAWAVTP